MKPVLQALVVADRVYRDGETGKSIIVGTFTQITTGVPVIATANDDEGREVEFYRGGMKPGSPWAYISLTEVRGRVPLHLRLVDYQTHEAIIQLSFVVECHNPLITLEFAIPLPELPVPGVGVYGIELTCADGEPLGAWRINVVGYSEGTGQPEEQQP